MMEIFEVPPQNNGSIKIFHLEEKIALVGAIAHHDIGTNGIFAVQVIIGCCEIFGVKLTPQSEPVRVYSSKEFSIKITPMLESKNKTVLNATYLESMNLSDNVKIVALKHFSGFSHLLMITLIENSNNFIKYIQNYIEMPIFSSRTFENFQISFNSDPVKCNFINTPSEWNYLGSALTKGPKKVLISGGKGVGKSTLLKYLINKSLGNSKKVLVLDFDPGQSEFTVMGCVSAVEVSEPLLGPNFSHLTVPVKCLYLGCTSVYDYSKEYKDCVGKLIELCSSTASYRDIPWFINTMGFVKGLGVTLLKDIILRVQPTDVIQINSKKQTENLPDRLTPRFVLDMNSSTKSLNYKLHTLTSVAGYSSPSFNPVTWGLNPVRKRGIVALSYFFNMINNEDFNFLECVPHKIKAKNVRVIVTANDAPIEFGIFHKLSSINGNMVALCTECDSEFLECKGFGIVRGVDYEREEIFIVTPMSESKLQEIKIIHMNSAIQLPQAVFKQQLSVVQEAAPYLARVYPSHLNKIIRKTTSRVRPVTDNYY